MLASIRDDVPAPEYALSAANRQLAQRNWMLQPREGYFGPERAQSRGVHEVIAAGHGKKNGPGRTRSPE